MLWRYMSKNNKRNTHTWTLIVVQKLRIQIKASIERGTRWVGIKHNLWLPTYSVNFSPPASWKMSVTEVKVIYIPPWHADCDILSGVATLKLTAVDRKRRRLKTRRLGGWVKAAEITKSYPNWAKQSPAIDFQGKGRPLGTQLSIDVGHWYP